jgi:hypothetical protein
MLDPTLILVAIDAAIKIGKKCYDVLVDETAAGSLLLPIGDKAGSYQESDAIFFFDRDENQKLVAPDGPYYDAWKTKGPQIIAAYHTVRSISDDLGGGAKAAADAVSVIQNLHKFEQYKQGFGPKSPWQRIAGTVVEVGIDFFLNNPQAVSMGSNARRVVTAFLTGIKDVPFAEGEPADIVKQTLIAALHVLGDNSSLVSHDPRIQVVLGGVTESLRADLLAGNISLGERQRREDLIERITASILRGAAGAVAANTQLFVKGDDKAKALVRDTLSEMLEGIRNQEDLFSVDTIEVLFDGALRAAAENTAVFRDQKIVQAVLKSTLSTMASAPCQKLFTGRTVAAIVTAAVNAVADNAGTLVDQKNLQHQVVADAIAAIAHGLATDVGAAHSAKDLLSPAQLIQLSQAVFQVVAKNPGRLLGAGMTPRETVLAQIIGSTAAALGKDPTQLVNGSALLDLLLNSMAIALKNRDKLIDLQSADPKTNLLYQVLNSVAEGVLSGIDTRHLMDSDLFLDIATRVLRVASANVAVLGPQAQLVNQVVVAALRLAAGSMQNQINGDNLPDVIVALLRAALQSNLHLDDPAAVQKIVQNALRTA